MNLQRQMLPLDSIKHAQINVILEHYGEEHQIIKACEELAELQVELFHIKPVKTERCFSERQTILSEVADVYIMLEQVIKIYNFTQKEIEATMTKKLRKAEDEIRDFMVKNAIGAKS